METYWKLMNLEPYEKELDIIFAEFLELHPEIELPAMAASIANVLGEILKQAPTQFRYNVLQSLVKGEKVKLELKQNS